jgi:AsmA family protein
MEIRTDAGRDGNANRRGSIRMSRRAGSGMRLPRIRTMPWLQGRRRARAALKWAGIVAGALVVALVLALLLVDWRRPLERFASTRLDRPVTIEGALDVRPWSLAPALVAERVTLGNPEWADERTMGTIERLTVRLRLLPLLRGDVILDDVVVVRPDVHLLRDASRQANWVFRGEAAEEPDANAPPPKLPAIQRLVVEDGKLEIVDEVRKLRFTGTIDAQESAASPEDKPFRLLGKGELNARPFELEVYGGPLIAIDPDEPYPFRLELKAADTAIGADGRVLEPFDLGKLDLRAHAAGNDMADLYYLTGIAIPNTPPYEVAATVERDGAHTRVSDIEGTLGRSDIRGEVEVDASGERPKVTGDVASNLLVFADLGALLGVRLEPRGAAAAESAAERGAEGAGEEAAVVDAGGAPDELADPAAAAAVGPEGPAADAQRSPAAPAGGDAPEAPDAALPAAAEPYVPLFPRARLQAERVRGMDADVRFAAKEIEGGFLPMENVAAHAVLDGGVLTVDPFTVDLPQGRVAGVVRVDARGDVPVNEVDVRVVDLQLEQVKKKDTASAPPLSGVMQARARLEGRGASVHEFAAGANGTITAVVPQGEVREALAELTGINVLRGLGLLMSDDQRRAQVRCGVANFDVKDGVMRAEHVVFDTEHVLVTGSGEVRLGPEELDLEIKGDPKELRAVRIAAPVELRGRLRDPQVGVDAGKAARQAGIAVALSAIVAPLAALIAFVDTGLAEDANCAALLAEAARVEDRAVAEHPMDGETE